MHLEEYWNWRRSVNTKDEIAKLEKEFDEKLAKLDQILITKPKVTTINALAEQLEVLTVSGNRYTLASIKGKGWKVFNAGEIYTDDEV